MTVTELDSPHRLRARIALLEEEVRQLQLIISPDWEPPPELCLTPSQGRMLACLFAHDRVCSEEMLWAASRRVCDYRCENGSNVVSVQVSHMRRKLEPFGMEILTVRGRGFRLSPEARAMLDGPAFGFSRKSGRAA